MRRYNVSHKDYVTHSTFASHGLHVTHNNLASHRAHVTHRKLASQNKHVTHYNLASYENDITHRHVASHKVSVTQNLCASHLDDVIHNVFASHWIFVIQKKYASHSVNVAQQNIASRSFVVIHIYVASHSLVLTSSPIRGIGGSSCASLLSLSVLTCRHRSGFRNHYRVQGRRASLRCLSGGISALLACIPVCMQSGYALVPHLLDGCGNIPKCGFRATDINLTSPALNSGHSFIGCVSDICRGH